MNAKDFQIETVQQESRWKDGDWLAMAKNIVRAEVQRLMESRTNTTPHPTRRDA